MGRKRKSRSTEPEPPLMEVYTVDLESKSSQSADKGHDPEAEVAKDSGEVAVKKKKLRSYRKKKETSSDEEVTEQDPPVAKNKRKRQEGKSSRPTEGTTSSDVDTPGPKRKSKEKDSRSISQRTRRRSSEVDSKSEDKGKAQHQENTDGEVAASAEKEDMKKGAASPEKVQRSTSGSWRVSGDRRSSSRRHEGVDSNWRSRDSRSSQEGSRWDRTEPRRSTSPGAERNWRSPNSKSPQEDKRRSHNEQRRSTSPKNWRKSEPRSQKDHQKRRPLEPRTSASPEQWNQQDTRNVQDADKSGQYTKPEEVNIRPSEDWRRRETPPKQDSSRSQQYGKPLNFSDLQRATDHPQPLGGSSMEQVKKMLYEVSEGAVAVVLPQHTTLMLAGYAQFRCLHGNINIMGHSLPPSQHYFPVYSPDSTSSISIVAKHHEDSSTDILRKSLQELEVADAVISDITEATTRTCSVFLLRRLESPMCDFVASAGNYRNLFKKPLSRGYRAPFYEELDKVGCCVAVGSDYDALNMSQPQQEFVNRFCQDASSGSSPVAVFCGGKNVGKSTMARHVMNSALNHCSTVACLECDVGQTELTPPGFVAVHLISQPLLGPPFTHQHEALCMCYMGAVSPAGNPHYYMECVRYVYKQFSMLETKPPLVVNTMGWNKGLGLSFLVETLDLVKPKYVVQLNSRSHNHNMEPVDRDFMETTPRLKAMSKYNQNQPNYQSDFVHELVTIQSPVQTRKDTFYRPVDHRNMALLAHLGKHRSDISPDSPLGSSTPVCLTWSSVGVHAMHEAVPNSQIMYALNGALVALCKAHPAEVNKMVAAEDPSLPKFFRNIPVCHCLGLGLVQGIDPDKKQFLVHCSVPSDSISEINCLLLGSVEMPQSFIMKQADADGHIPYVGESKDVTGATSIKPRRHMQRGYNRPEND